MRKQSANCHPLTLLKTFSWPAPCNTKSNSQTPNHGWQGPICFPNFCSYWNPGYTSALILLLLHFWHTGLFLTQKYTKLIPTSGPLHMLLPFPQTFFSQLFAWLAPFGFWDLSKCVPSSERASLAIQTKVSLSRHTPLYHPVWASAWDFLVSEISL